MACWLQKNFMQAAATLKVDVDFPRLSILSLDFDWLYPKTRGLILHSYSWQSHVSWYLTLSFSATSPSPVYFISSFLKITNAIIAIIITVTIITIIAIITYYYYYYILLSQLLPLLLLLLFWLIAIIIYYYYYYCTMTLHLDL